ncbi:hypothetical protein GGS20DRAFT_541325 [Poronia punctata]|nr:hypothetical protein GGS20DRAFT_541325 [Poronia punctata]
MWSRQDKILSFLVVSSLLLKCHVGNARAGCKIGTSRAMQVNLSLRTVPLGIMSWLGDFDVVRHLPHGIGRTETDIIVAVTRPTSMPYHTEHPTLIDGYLVGSINCEKEGPSLLIMYSMPPRDIRTCNLPIRYWRAWCQGLSTRRNDEDPPRLRDKPLVVHLGALILCKEWRKVLPTVFCGTKTWGESLPLHLERKPLDGCY